MARVLGYGGLANSRARSFGGKTSMSQAVAGFSPRVGYSHRRKRDVSRFTLFKRLVMEVR